MLNCYLATPADTSLVTPLVSLYESARQELHRSSQVLQVDDPDRADFIWLIEEFGFKQYRHKQLLLNDSFVAPRLQKILTLNYDDHPVAFLPGLYTSLSKRQFHPEKHSAICYPKTHNSFMTTTFKSERKYFFSFQGNVESHLVRKQLVRALSCVAGGYVCPLETPFHAYADADRFEYARVIEDSYFVLCPRGFSPSSYRLFEAMESGRCPVIISDDWVPPRNVEWSEFSVFVLEKDVAIIPQILEKVTDPVGLGRRAREVWMEHFSPGARNARYLKELCHIWSKQNADTGSCQAEWHSRSFRREHRLLWHQRISNRLKGMLDRVFSNIEG